MAKKQEYGNESITSLKGADRVRKRPAVIFGSDGVEGCAHSIFEIVSNSIDEARDGHGDTINVTRCKDGSVIVEDFGRGMPVDWNNGEGRFNWELLFCEMYAGGKYGEGEDNYEFSLGLNGLGLCATQYASAWMTADIATVTTTIWTLKRARTWAACKRSPTRAAAPAVLSTGSRTMRCLPISMCPAATIRMCCAVRPWSTRGLPSTLPMKRKKTPPPASRGTKAGATRTASRTMWQK